METQDQELQSASQVEKCQGSSVSRKRHLLGHRCAAPSQGATQLLSSYVFNSVSACFSYHDHYLLLSPTFCLLITSSYIGHCNLNPVSWRLYTFYNLQLPCFIINTFPLQSHEKKLTGHPCTGSPFPIQSLSSIMCYRSTCLVRVITIPPTPNGVSNHSFHKLKCPSKFP